MDYILRIIVLDDNRIFYNKEFSKSKNYFMKFVLVLYI